MALILKRAKAPTPDAMQLPVEAIAMSQPVPATPTGPGTMQPVSPVTAPTPTKKAAKKTMPKKAPAKVTKKATAKKTVKKVVGYKVNVADISKTPVKKTVVVKKAAKKAPGEKVLKAKAQTKVAKKATKKAADKAYRNPQPRQLGKRSGLTVSEFMRYMLDANSYAGGVITEKQRHHKGTDLPKGMKVGKPFTDAQLKALIIDEFPGRTSNIFSDVANTRRLYNTGTMRHNGGQMPAKPSPVFVYDAAGNPVQLEQGKRVLPKTLAASAAPKKKLIVKKAKTMTNANKKAPVKKTATKKAVKGLVVKKAATKKTAVKMVTAGAKKAPAKKTAKKAAKKAPAKK